MVEYISVLALIGVVGCFWWFKKKRQQQPVQPFPKAWEAYIAHSVCYKRLPAADKKRFQQRVMEFLAAVHIEGVQTNVTDEDKVLVAAAAVIPTLGFKEWYYPNLTSVLLYPDAFNKDFEFGTASKERVIMGMVGSGRLKNTMILSKKALHHGFNNESDKLNTAIHEFVHLIDGVDGAIDGIPEQLLQEPNTLPWLKLMHDTMEQINRNKSDIRSYGGTSQQEFFAVASEYFFSRPKLMQRKHPELYAMLEQCFRQDPSTTERL